jgi:hypothetical protein
MPILQFQLNLRAHSIAVCNWCWAKSVLSCMPRASNGRGLVARQLCRRNLVGHRVRRGLQRNFAELPPVPASCRRASRRVNIGRPLCTNQTCAAKSANGTVATGNALCRSCFCSCGTRVRVSQERLTMRSSGPARRKLPARSNVAAAQAA